jgi:hypothetical protein
MGEEDGEKDVDKGLLPILPEGVLSSLVRFDARLVLELKRSLLI